MCLFEHNYSLFLMAFVVAYFCGLMLCLRDFFCFLKFNCMWTGEMSKRMHTSIVIYRQRCLLEPFCQLFCHDKYWQAEIFQLESSPTVWQTGLYSTVRQGILVKVHLSNEKLNPYRLICELILHYFSISKNVFFFFLFVDFSTFAT